LPVGEKIVLEDPNYIYKIDEEGNITEESKEEIDYENMTAKELIEEGKKLLEEAKDIAYKGKTSKIKELTDKGNELIKRGEELLRQYLLAADIIFAAIKELVQETNIKASAQAFDEANDDLKNAMYTEQGLDIEKVQEAEGNGSLILLSTKSTEQSNNTDFGEKVANHYQKKRKLIVDELLMLLVAFYLSEDILKDNLLEDALLDGMSLIEEVGKQKKEGIEREVIINYAKNYIVEKLNEIAYRIITQDAEE